MEKKGKGKKHIRCKKKKGETCETERQRKNTRDGRFHGKGKREIL